MKTLLLAALALLGGVAVAADADSHRTDYNYCTLCHGANGGGDEAIAAPAIKDIEPWYLASALADYRSGVRGKVYDDDTAGSEMRSVVREIAPGSEQAIIAFLDGLPATRATATLEGKPAEGGKLYQQTCAACHGPQGHGNEALHAPDLTRLNDWYIASSFQRYKDGVRGADAAANLWANQMHLIVRDLPADYGINDIAAWLATQTRNKK